MNTISKEKYDLLIESKEKGTYANHICNAKCSLGKTVNFKVEGTNLSIKMKCTQIGGIFSGTHCFVLA